jgi:hypothetical protein
MASSKIYQAGNALLKFVVSKNFFLSKVSSFERKSFFTEKYSRNVSIKNKQYGSVVFKKQLRTTVITEELPFRIRFTTIGIEGYGPNNPPPIGIAVIGFNNYIL